MTVESKANLAQTSASQGPPRLHVLPQLLKTHKSLHANQLQRQHWCVCLCAENTRGDENSSLGRRVYHVEGKGWETPASATCRVLCPLHVSLWLHPIQLGSVEQGPSLPDRELLQGSLSVPVTTQGSPVAALEYFVLFLLVYVENQQKCSLNAELLRDLQLFSHVKFKGYNSCPWWSLRGVASRASTCPGRAALVLVRRESGDFLPSFWYLQIRKSPKLQTFVFLILPVEG